MKPKLEKSWIDSHALDIVKKLQEQNYETYLVGGCVRDLLLGIAPKDFDIVTLAKPQEIRRSISQAYIIGKRFRLVLAKRGDLLLEIATFRSNDPQKESLAPELEEEVTELEVEDPPLFAGDNFYGTPEEDARRRDFTINGLYYDPFTEKVIDFVEGLKDLEGHRIRMIGEPQKRLEEDPIRILRGLRLAHKVKFQIEPELRAAIVKTAPTLSDTPLSRRREELLKFLRLADPSLVFLEAFDLGVFQYMAPVLHKIFSDTERAQIFTQYLRTANEKNFSKEEPLFLFGFLVHAYIRCFIEPDPLIPLSGKKLLQNKELQSLMKNDLGMFNLEIELVLRATKLQKTLQERAFYEEKGEKALLSVFKNEALPLALYFARKDFLISPEDWLFWYNGYNQSLPHLLLTSGRERKRKRN